jgi:ABC transport system ATP-binding/permease protein
MSSSRAGMALLPRGTSASDIRVDADRVSKRVRGQQTLREVSLAIAPGTLVAIAGLSGAGKTMLLETLAGLRTPDEGTVRYDGVACHANLDAIRSSLGYVPQDDIIHRELPLERTLRHAARRLPPAATAALRDDAVRRVLHVLGLTNRANVTLGSLSGGERKQSSLAGERFLARR